MNTNKVKVLNNLDLDLHSLDSKKKKQCVVRLTTSVWSDKRGIHLKKSLLFLKTKSYGFQILSEDIACIGANEILPRIINLQKCDDGIYEVIVINEQRDWESGTIEDYDYKLISFK